MSRPDEPLSTRDLASPTSDAASDPEARDKREPEPATQREDANPPDDSERTSAPTDDAPRSAREADAGVAEPDAAGSAADPPHEADRDQASLLGADQNAELGGQWESIQANFVDDPRSALVLPTAPLGVAGERPKAAGARPTTGEEERAHRCVRKAPRSCRVFASFKASAQRRRAWSAPFGRAQPRAGSAGPADAQRWKSRRARSAFLRVPKARQMRGVTAG
jgi:hypothetical protein